jgi:hypothetical protein
MKDAVLSAAGDPLERLAAGRLISAVAQLKEDRAMSADRHQAHHRDVLAAQRYGELHRLNIGLEVLNRTTEQVSRQLDVVARTEAALQYVVRAWRAIQPPEPRR